MARKKSKDAPSKAAPVALTFEERLQPFLQRVSEITLELQKRRGGALRFGRNGAHILMVEAASVSETAGVPGYMSAAAFAIIAAMMTTGVFNDKSSSPEAVVSEEAKPKTSEEAS